MTTARKKAGVAAGKLPTRKQKPDLVDRKMKVWSAALKDADLTAFEIAIRLQRLSLLAGLPLVDLLKPFKLAPGDADVIANLFEVGPPYALTPGKLSELCFVTTGAMTGRIDRLERSGMVTRVRSESDRRSQEVRLTKKGAEVAVTIGRQVMDAEFATAARTLSRTDLRELARILRELEAKVAE